VMRGAGVCLRATKAKALRPWSMRIEKIGFIVAE
jgi:hypothetical protein